MKLLHESRATAARAFRWDRSDPLSLPAFALLLVTVAVAPFPWGRVVSGDTLVLELLSFSTAALAALTRGYRVPLGRAWVPMAALAALALLGFLQAAPLPEGLLSRVAPESARAWRDANAVLAAHGRDAQPFRVSLAPAETRATALLGLSYVALFFAAARVAASRHRRRVFVAVLLGTAFAAIATAVTRGEGLERIRDPFVNPNHLAGYLQVALAVAFGLQWSQLRKADRGAEGWLALLAASGKLVVEGDQVGPPGTRAGQVAEESSGFAARIAEAYRKARFEAPKSFDLAREVGTKPAVVDGLVSHLLKTGVLLRLSPDVVVHRDAVEEAAGKLPSVKGKTLTVGDFRDLLGLTRKTLIPLLEHFDRKKLTRRQGDVRLVE